MRGRFKGCSWGVQGAIRGHSRGVIRGPSVGNHGVIKGVQGAFVDVEKIQGIMKGH